MLLLLASASSAQQPPGQFSKYWRNFFTNKGEYPTMRLNQAGGDIVLGLAQSNFVTSSPSTFAALVINESMSQLGNAIYDMHFGTYNPPPPVILGLDSSSSQVKVTFKGAPGNACIYNLLHFENADARPRLVSSIKAYYYQDAPPLVIVDSNPPSSGTSFYSMTAISNSRYENALEDAQIAQAAVTPWWSLTQTGADIKYKMWWANERFGRTSDYSNPVVYIAGPKPDLGDIDAIAVSKSSGDVYVSRPVSKQITRMVNTGNFFAPEISYASIPFKAPGQKGLGIDRNGNLFTDNSASDAEFGGRIFRFAASNRAMEFTGSVNYFSQLLMFANPVSVTQMVAGPDNDTGIKDDLYVFDAMSREVKRVPVNASYDTYRRVGLPYYRYDQSDSGSPIDLDVQTDNYGGGMLYLLDSNSVKGILLGQKSIPGIETEKFFLK